MADRDGLGDLPLFDTEVRPVREFVAQEQRQEDDYQYITRMYSALARQILDLIEDICDQMEYEGSRMFDEYMDETMPLGMVDVRFMIRSIIKRSKIVRRKNISDDPLAAWRRDLS